LDNSIEDALKKIDELLTRQEDEKEKMLKEIRSELSKFDLSLKTEKTEGQEVLHEGKNQQKDIEILENDENISLTSDTKEPLLVAVAGTKSRVGTTHCVVSIANYLTRQRKRTAVMEFNDSGEFSAMGRYFDQASEEEFFHKDVKYYAGCTLQLLDQIAATGKYDFLILDLGKYSAKKTLFSRSDMKFIVSGGKPWELDSLLPIFQEINKKILFQTNFVFNFVPETEKEAIADGMGVLEKVFFSSFVEDPFLEIDESIEGIFKEYADHEDIPERNDSKEKKKTLKILGRRSKNEKNAGRGKEKRNLVQAVPATE